MRHLVTGGAGFLGSHLCERLLARGDEVIVLDNLFTSRRKNIEHLFRYHAFEFVRGDVCDKFHFEVDRIWHLACPASPIHYQRNAVRTVKTSVIGTVHALELAREVGARFLLTSTSEIYGDPAVHPQVEGYHGNVNPVGPRACYDEGKRCAETLAASFAAQYGVEVKIARLFNCYGPRMAADDGRVVSNFITQALRGEPLTIYGDGTQTRSFIYVDDMVEGLVRLMDRGPQAVPVNLGNPGEFTIRQLGDLVKEMVSSRVVGRRDPGYDQRPLPIDDPTRRRPDITRALQLLGWVPKVELEKGLAETVEYFAGELREVEAA